MTVEQRAMQVWSVLVLAARNQQLLSYQMLADLTGLPVQMGNFLGPVASYCEKHGLPQITSIVVSQETGLPGHLYPGANAATDQARTFVYDWLAHNRKNRPSPGDFASQPQTQMTP